MIFKTLCHKFYSFLLLSIILLFSCGGSDLPDFQTNTYSDYRMFNVLDKYPAIYDAVNSLSQDTFNSDFASAVNAKTPEYLTMSDDLSALINNKDAGYPLQSTLAMLKDVLFRVINQDTLDKETDTTDYAGSLYGFLENIRSKDLNITGDMLDIMRTGMAYDLDMENANAGYLAHKTDDANAELLDPRTKTVLLESLSNLSKLAIQGNNNLHVTSSASPFGDIIEDGTGGVDTGLGNPVNGLRALVKGGSELLADTAVRNSIYDLIREGGSLASVKIPGTTRGLKDIMKDEMISKRNLFTRGGTVYGSSAHGVYPNTNVYNTNNTTTYSDSESRSTTKEVLPGMISLLLRDDRQGSIAKNSGDKEYPAKRIADAIAQLDVNWDNLRIEESIYDLLRYDAYGRDRKTDTNAYPLSFIEGFLTTGTLAASMGWNEGGSTGESTNSMAPNKDHGHGAPTGYITVNDSIFSILTQNTIDLGGGVAVGMYEAGFLNDGNIFRSIDSFTFTDIDVDKDVAPYKCTFDHAMPALAFLTGMSVGDAGTPSGGNQTTAVVPKNGYKTWSPDGLSELNTSTWNVSWLVRATWGGQGPYYYANSAAPTTSINGKNCYTYYRPDGKVYAYVYKPTSTRSSWEYYYPVNADCRDAADRYIELPVKNVTYPVVISASSVVTVSIDNSITNRDITFAAGSYTLDQIVSTIGAALGSAKYIEKMYNTDYGINGFLLHGLVNDNSAKIVITDKSGNSLVQKLFGKQTGTTSIALNTVERYNRFKDTWRTDYYMIKSPNYLGSYNKRYTPEDTGGSANNSSAIWFKELISDSDEFRECASQEEAILRNYQWVVTEKKMVIVIPFQLEAMGLDKISFYQVIEGNGFEGLVNCRKNKANKVWAKKGVTGGSAIPGDYRFDCRFSPAYLGLLTSSSVYNSSLGNGSVNPSIIPHNYAPVTRLGFPRSATADLSAGYTNPVSNVSYGNTSAIYNYTVGSREFLAADSDANWKKRNGIVPLMMALFGAAWDLSDNNNHTLSSLLDAGTVLLKPQFYFNKNNTDGDPVLNSWIVRIAGGSNVYDFMRSDADGTGQVLTGSTGWFGGWASRNYYQTTAYPNGLSLMIDSDSDLNGNNPRTNLTKRVDGFLPALTAYNVANDRGTGNEPNSRIVTKLMKLLVNMNNPAFDDPGTVDDEDITTFGTKRKLFYGLEQIATDIRMSKAPVIILNEGLSYKNNGRKFPNWMFRGNGVRDEDVLLDDILNLSVGSTAAADSGKPEFNMGLAGYVTERPPYGTVRDWSSFDEAADKSVEFMSSKGPGAGKYNILETLIGVMDKVMSQVSPTQDQANGLIHTLGIVSSVYDSGAWNTKSDLLTIMTQYLPAISEAFKANAKTNTEFNNLLMGEGELVDYLANSISSTYSSEDIFSDLYGLLNDPLISDPTSNLWNDMTDLISSFKVLLNNDNDSQTYYESGGFQYNGSFVNSGLDLYSSLGKVFSE